MSVRDVPVDEKTLPGAMTDSYRRLRHSLVPTGGLARDSSNWVWGWPGRLHARGPLSAAVLSATPGRPGTLSEVAPADADVIADEDFQLALFLCNQWDFSQSARPDHPWDEELVQFRTALDEVFVESIRADVGPFKPRRTNDLIAGLRELAVTCSGPSVPKYLCDQGSLDQLREYLIHRSVHELRVECDATRSSSAPHLAHEHDDRRTRASFGDTMTTLNLDATPGAYVVRLPASTLATANLGATFARHPQWHGALSGLAAVTAMTSVASKSQFGMTLARFGIGADGRRFFDAAVDVSAQEALRAHLTRTEPGSRADVLFGAACALRLEKRASRHVLGSWAKQRSSLTPR